MLMQLSKRKWIGRSFVYSRILGRLNDVHFTDDTIAVDLMDGRAIIVPLAWYH